MRMHRRRQKQQSAPETRINFGRCMINCLRHRGSGRASSIIWGMKLGAKELRLTKRSEAVSAIAKLKNQNSKIKIIAVEQDERAIPYNSPLHPSLNLREGTPIAIVVGHETEGVSKEVLDMADVIVEIPMYGVNRSMNVVVATGIGLSRFLG